ncbi:ABC transporter substrate-binding protein [Lacticaseibacillus sharpeae]|uniref:ATP-binding cassette transporter n=1 Tax=Lacticaseibacillus sharpeae JCM 1186 = DSM 20505 TaxID=1291052 RepID=A0A0R1ZSM7_9LACO|nr:ABC transporter substrate-binding protein [Lacticaseibacillus sharpeae]KRM56212.1 ATP-binding cassette transporter [Lacticaseibacillus sharpeae JCM 1186 = DSM 20505]
MKLKKIMTAAMTVATVALLAACGNKADSSASKDKVTKIGILQLINQSALDDARKGFEQELAAHGYKDGKNIKIDYVNAQGDQSNLTTMSQRLKRDKNAFNLAIATPAAQALQKADPDTPMLFTAITDPKSAGLVSNVNAPDKNATGVTDAVDIPGQIGLLHKMFPKAKTVGLLYNAAEPNSVIQIKEARKAIKKLGLKSVEKTIASTNDAEQTATALAGQADAIYIPTDNTAAAAMSTIGKVSEKAKVPVVNADATMIKQAGVATRGISYKQLGKQTADMAIKILKGKKVKQLAVEKPAKTSIVKDDKRMKLFNVDPSVLK